MDTFITAPLILYVLILLLKPELSSTCHYEFEMAAEARFREDTVRASQELFCSCGSNSCAFQITYEHTSEWSHTVEGSVSAGFFNFFSTSFSYSHSWGQSASVASSVTCTANPGYKVWIAVVPKMMRVLGWGRQKCSGATREEAWLDIKAPLTTGNKRLDAEVWCKVERFHTCVENAHGTCHGINEYADTHGAYCRDNCAAGYCPSRICAC